MSHKEMEPMFFQTEPLFKKHKGKKGVEFEMRLGRVANGRFDTNLGKDAFQKIQMALGQYKKWERVEDNVYDSYYGAKSLRTNRFADDSQESIIKRRVEVVDYSAQDLPFDIRFAVSTETKTEPDEDVEYEFVKNKKRTSYTRKGVRIDCTVVSGDPDDKDAEESEEYQVEIELVDVKAVKNKSTLYNFIYKARDVCNCL